MDAADKVSVARSTILTQPKSVAPELAEAGFDLDTSPKGGIVAIGVHAHGPALHLDFSSRPCWLAAVAQDQHPQPGCLVGENGFVATIGVGHVPVRR